MPCKPQLKPILLLQNAISPRLEQALKAVELAFETTIPQPQRGGFGAVIETRMICNMIRRNHGVLVRHCRSHASQFRSLRFRNRVIIRGCLSQ